MTWLNYHHLLYFWKVAKTGSVTAASKELRLAHPTLSAQIRTLEKSLGHKLFRQVGRRLQLTETGQLVYRYANDIFPLGEELIQAYLKLKMQEWNDYTSHLSEWERRNTLDC